MATSLDVLVLESTPHGADRAASRLEASGHRVHRCHEEGERGFPCVGIAGTGGCPVDHGIDVTVLVRSRVMPRPTDLEDGMRCAIRAGVPVVEQGPETLDPFAPWISRRVGADDDLSVACHAAIDDAFAPLRDQIKLRIAPLATAIGIDPTAVRCRIELAGPSLDVHLDLPRAAARASAQALAVRVLDAVRSMGRTTGNVDVFVHDPDGPLLGH
jgi:hypothetical protein